MKKVLHILNSLLPSGAETMLVNSADKWIGWEKHVLATSSDLGSFAEKFEEAGYIVHHIGTKNQLEKHYKICKLIKMERFDVVHIHTEASSLRYAIDAKICGCKRIVRTVHSIFYSHKPVAIIRGFANFKRGLRRHIETNLLGVCYVAIGQSVFDNEWNRYRNKCMIIYNWCDENTFIETTKIDHQYARDLLRIKENEFCIVSVGNCNEIKNHRMLIDALHQLKKEHASLPMVYFHIGNGDQETKEKELAEKYMLSNAIHFEGRCSPKLYFQAGDLYVMTSKFEGFGISAMESAYTGLPMILTDVQGLKDFKDLKLDDIQYVHNVDELTQKIYEAYVKFQKCGWSHSQLLAKKVRGYYSMSKSVGQYMEVYEKGWI